MKYDVIIVGAGASGMMAAITAASHHKKVLLLERMDKLGKKILATGNGRCNLSNAYMDENCYRGQRPSFAYPMIEEFGLEDLIQFFESLGMLVTEQNGYYYPASLQAATVVDTLTQKLDVYKRQLLATSIEDVDMNGLRELGDNLKEKLGEGVIVLASQKDGKVFLVAMVTDEAQKAGAHAGNLIKAIAGCVGGGGGGRPNMAQAGGKNPAGIPEAVAKVKEILESQIS